MAITSEIIGKLGGADVEVIPVEGTASGSKGSSEVIATIDVPAGETWLVAAIGQTTAGSGASAFRPRFYLGEDLSARPSPGETSGLARVATEPISLSIKRETGSGVDSFTGHVYTVKM